MPVRQVDQLAHMANASAIQVYRVTEANIREVVVEAFSHCSVWPAWVVKLGYRTPGCQLI